MTAKLLGAFGEMQAAEYLKKRGYKILALNYRCTHGEIDIIAKKRSTTVMVEVKTRRSKRWAEAGEYVDGAKQRKLRLTAAAWLEQCPDPQCGDDCRFDVIEVYANGGEASDSGGPGFRVYEINHIKEAF